jgi:hypothetical protein
MYAIIAAAHNHVMTPPLVNGETWDDSVAGDLWGLDTGAL